MALKLEENGLNRAIAQRLLKDINEDHYPHIHELLRQFAADRDPRSRALIYEGLTQAVTKASNQSPDSFNLPPAIHILYTLINTRQDKQLAELNRQDQQRKASLGLIEKLKGTAGTKLYQDMINAFQPQVTHLPFVHPDLVEVELQEGGPLSLTPREESIGKNEKTTTLKDWGGAFHRDRQGFTEQEFATILRASNPSVTQNTLEDWTASLASYLPDDLLTPQFYTDAVQTSPLQPGDPAYSDDRVGQINAKNTNGYQCRIMDDSTAEISSTLDFHVTNTISAPGKADNVSYLTCVNGAFKWTNQKPTHPLFSVTYTSTVTRADDGSLTATQKPPVLDAPFEVDQNGPSVHEIIKKQFAPSAAERRGFLF